MSSTWRRGGVRACAVGALAALVALSPVPAAATEVPGCGWAPHTAQFYDEVLRSNLDGWDEADGGVPILLDDGGTLWLYGDTFVGRRDAAGYRKDGFRLVTNTALVSRGGCLRTLGTTSEGAWIPPLGGAGHYLWPAGGYQRGDQIVLFAATGRYGSGVLGMQPQGIVVVTVDARTFSVVGKPVPVATPLSAGTSWGNAAVLSEDGSTVYVYGVEGRHLYVAAVDPDRPTGPWRFWDGESFREGAAPVPVLTVARIAPSHVIPHPDGGYLMTGKEDSILGDGINAWVAPTPVGPWVAQGRILDTKVPAGQFTYGGQPHPVLTDGQKLLVAWSTNTFAAPSGGARHGIYVVRHAEVDVPSRHPDAVPRARPRRDSGPSVSGPLHVTGDGAVFSAGAAGLRGWVATWAIPGFVMGGAPSPAGGYWLFNHQGRIYTFGGARSYSPGAGPGHPATITAMASTSTGRGYWLAAADGKVLPYGDAVAKGSAAGRMRSGERVVAMAGRPTRQGYWLVTNLGAVHAFGDAPVLGSAHRAQLRRGAAVGIRPTASGSGYVVVDGGRVRHGFGDGIADAGFVDIRSGMVHAEAVMWLVKQGITRGTTPTTFSPERTTSRAQMASFLWRMTGQPPPRRAVAMPDLGAAGGHADAVRWLAAEGAGVGADGRFRPSSATTRAEMAVFLWAVAGRPDPPSPAAFTDVAPSHAAAPAIAWLAAAEVTRGVGDGTRFAPAASVTRGQMALFINRFHNAAT